MDTPSFNLDGDGTDTPSFNLDGDGMDTPSFNLDGDDTNTPSFNLDGDDTNTPHVLKLPIPQLFTCDWVQDWCSPSFLHRPTDR